MGSEGETSFVEGDLLEAKLFGNDVFPKTLLPAAGSDRNLAKAVIADRGSLTAALRRHRALLFRGFEVGSVDDFERAVEAFDWDCYRGLEAANTRIKLSDRIYTSSETSPELLINFHHELALRESPPSKIFFYCNQPPLEGGETSIVASDVVVEEMERRMPEVMAKVAEFGLVHVFKTFGDGDASKGVLSNSWKSFLGTDDGVEARKRAMRRMNCSAADFFSDGRAVFTFGPLNPVKERDERRAWIAPILGFSDDANLVSDAFGDGKAFPREAVGTYRDIVEENCVDIKWQKGDVLLLDNHAVMHARRPGKPPRRVLVSMCK